MDDGAAGLLKEALSFQVSPSETPGTFDPNTGRLRERNCSNGNRATSPLYYNVLS